MIQAISKYHKVVFASPDEAQAACAALMNVVNEGLPGTPTVIGGERVVFWEEGLLGLRLQTLYLSPGALAVLHGVMSVPASEIVSPADLPKNRTLLAGEARDWDDTGGRPDNAT